jgi:RNA polymerase sigma factor (sigma-70 family)
MTDDYTLIQAARTGDNDAWRTLIERYQRLIFFIANQYNLTAADADELVQMTFTTLLESLHVFHAESNVKSWLGTVAKRHAYRFLHRYDRIGVYAAEDLAGSKLLDSQAVEDDRGELAEWLHDGLQRLRTRCRDLLFALYFDDNSPSYEEIARRFKLRVGSIGATRARCLAQLRDILDEIGK